MRLTGDPFYITPASGRGNAAARQPSRDPVHRARSRTGFSATGIKALVAVLTGLILSLLGGCKSGGGEPSDPSDGGACAAPATACGDQCVDTENDPGNCGSCGEGCALGEVCVHGTCGLACLGGTTACGARCVDTSVDPHHCGGCGDACGAGEVCSFGVCGFSCLGGTAKCGDKCVDTNVDPQNCGGCGSACETGEACSSGVCGFSCLGGTAKCGDKCVDANVDPQNCGSCGHACPAGEVCANGSCSSACSGALIQCGALCVDPASNPVHCGGCGHVCPVGDVCSGGACSDGCESGLSKCGGSCVDTSTSAANCGACFAACNAGEACSGGACLCATGQPKCGGKCIDLSSDATNCGVCGVACGFNEVCSSGACACAPGTSKCGAACIDTGLSMANCGSCGNACGAGQVCTGGVCGAPTSHWRMLGADEQHSGVNAEETGKPPLSFGWSVPLSKSALSPLVVEDGRVFLTANGYFQMETPLLALSVSDGSVLWSYNFGSVFGVGHPSAVGGKVFVQNCNHTPGTKLWIFDAASGNPLLSAPFGAQWENYWSPLVVGNNVYINGGYYGGLYGFDATSGAQLFFSNSLEQYDEWSPAYFKGSVYSFVAGNLRAHDPMAGTVAWTASTTWNWAGWSMHTAPVFGDTFGYVISPPNLYGIDPSKQSIAWTANGTYSGMAAVANGAVYAISGGSLLVRDAATGALLWTFAGDGDLKYTPVLAAGYVYVASGANTYAVDTTTHAQAWKGPGGGFLAIASGRLLVAKTDGTLVAYLLSN